MFFKKKSRPQAKKRQVSESESNDEEDTVAIELDDLKFAQKNRRGHKGVGNMPNKEEVKVEEADDSDSDPGGLQEMNNRFGHSGSSNQKNQMDPQLELFLKEQIKELNLTTPQSQIEKDAEAAEKKRNEQLEAAAEIYRIPEELKPTEHMVAKSEEMSWMAGLLEVSTGVESQLRNIEETEIEKKKWLESLAHRQDKEEDFRTNRQINKVFGNRFRAYQMRQEHPGKGGSKGGSKGGGGGSKGGGRATPYNAERQHRRDH